MKVYLLMKYSLEVLVDFCDDYHVSSFFSYSYELKTLLGIGDTTGLRVLRKA